MSLLDPLLGAVGSITDLATFVLVGYLSLKHGPVLADIRAGLVAVARATEDVDDDQLQSDLDVDEKHISPFLLESDRE